MGALYSLFSSVEASGLPQHSVVRALDVRADGVIASRLDLEASIPLVYLERVRFAGDEPLALDRVWLPATLAEGLLDADFSHTSLYNELAERTGLRLDHGREDIRAVNPTSAGARTPALPRRCRRLLDQPPRPRPRPQDRVAAHRSTG